MRLEGFPQQLGREFHNVVLKRGSGGSLTKEITWMAGGLGIGIVAEEEAQQQASNTGGQTTKLHYGEIYEHVRRLADNSELRTTYVHGDQSQGGLPADRTRHATPND